MLGQNSEYMRQKPIDMSCKDYSTVNIVLSDDLFKSLLSLVVKIVSIYKLACMICL